MERRGSDRIRRRVACTFEYEGCTHEGVVADVSAGGLFLQTDAGIALGSELTLSLRDPGRGEVALRGRVVRRRFTPAAIARWIRRGVGIQILSAPETYRDLLHGGAPAPDAAWSALCDLEPPFELPRVAGRVALDVAVEAEACGASVCPEPERDSEPSAAPSPEPAEASPPDHEVDATPLRDAREPLEQRVRAEDPRVEPASPAPLPAPALCRADALLIHDGELADVESLLEAMGADVVRRSRIEPSAFTGWEKPPRLIVASGRSALRLSMGNDVEGQSIVTIAVVDSESQTLCGMLRRQGFRYVVRRPVHPEALRLLLGRALFRGRERRDAARVSLGCEVGLRYGLRRKPATLLELSRTGCRVLLPEWVEPGARLSLRIPSPVTGNRPLALVGRVLRSERQRRPGNAHDVAAALRFDRLDAATRMRLDALIAAHTLGPTPLERAAAGGTPGTPTPHEAAAPAAPSATFTGESERRRGPRVSHRHEVIALEPELSRVRHTLLGIDLSAGGIRVEPHPELTIGDRVRIAIYDAASNATLVVDAEAVRDEGRLGVVLQFRNVSEEARRQIERIVAATPQIESAGAAPGHGVVVAEMLAQQPA
jgi:c-di-GMP-binding flagellar brake protein YcgR